ncbi:TPA: hypothetical protein HA242_03945 [Candidatus Woesearchaeota archaeon]|nr:hypothetical protein [Candidatus Woesearchaeota archaeon]HIG92902.1 hypothetical protein [Candidatus Woesearchaeota archaeon]HIH12849.1 hypothetical protein [Candidatus Woesearchaeota archaeon]
MHHCPKCKSPGVNITYHNGIPFLHCRHCGYNELAEEDTFPEDRTSQREKGRYSPYKTGGSGRTRLI